ncbi:cyanoexosortase B system-associated protein [Spirulina subsalsa FACHB-351]|uniref:Cyanoexosortase B system-associated protein n=1 Tax=Spirulina subsalsa FACHB-351 TaxID=234711 RepID=A0ABT3L474_9CYAN|nr:cyanoexosortase B system-associated protein [Spirulina subsalsa]MCW6036299.1 cyanoexosortase B system-associated protein [Spirulina subsalsa FACHB-351]
MKITDTNPQPIPSPTTASRVSRPHLAMVILLAIVLLVVAIPQYIQGAWSWREPPAIPALSEMLALTGKGLELPGWTTQEQTEVRLGGQSWSGQSIIGDAYDRPITLLLLPQKTIRDQPDVEWVDVSGQMRWKMGAMTTLQVEVEQEGNTIPVSARFFQAFTEHQTFAVVQWYALDREGTPTPGRWFWLDQIAQLRGQRVPWIAVSLLIPVSPLRDLEDSEGLATALIETVQSTIMNDVF